MSADWVVTIEAKARVVVERDTESSVVVEVTVLTEDLVDELVDGLPAAAVAVGDDRLSVSFSVDARGAAGAVRKGLEMWTTSPAAAGLVVVRIEVVAADDVDAELERPNFPALLGVAELAERLGVSKARASELARLESFPHPVARLASGPIWSDASVSGHLEGWSRKPGRPRKAPQEAAIAAGVARAVRRLVSEHVAEPARSERSGDTS